MLASGRLPCYGGLAIAALLPFSCSVRQWAWALSCFKTDIVCIFVSETRGLHYSRMDMRFGGLQKLYGLLRHFMTCPTLCCPTLRPLCSRLIPNDFLSTGLMIIILLSPPLPLIWDDHAHNHQNDHHIFYRGYCDDHHCFVSPLPWSEMKGLRYVIALFHVSLIARANIENINPVIIIVILVIVVIFSLSS